jgi:hypothetical protein
LAVRDRNEMAGFSLNIGGKASCLKVRRPTHEYASNRGLDTLPEK